MQKYRLLTDEQPAIDQKWFDRLNGIAGTAAEVYMVLGPPESYLLQAKRAFHTSGGRQMPNLRPHVRDIALYEAHIGQLNDLKSDILEGEPNEPIRDAYTRRIDELIANNQLFIAAVRDDRRQFADQNRFIYGAPSTGIFNGACAWILAEAKAGLDSSHPAVAQAAGRVLASVPDLGGRAADILPDADTFNAVREIHHAPGGYLEQLFAGARLPEGEVTSETGDPVIRQVLGTIGSDYHIADSPNHLWGIFHAKQYVLRPRSYRLRREEFTALIAHEIGSHLLERINGLRQPLRLFGIGFDRYELGNEGRALLREQIIYPTLQQHLGEPDWQDAVMKHFAVCLGIGLLGEPRDFTKLYNAVYPIYAMWERTKRPADPQASDAIAHDRTWNTVARVLKGTDGRGGAYLKDIVYLEGNAACWQAAGNDPAIIMLGDTGKFDITNPRHLNALVPGSAGRVK